LEYIGRKVAQEKAGPDFFQMSEKFQMKNLKAMAIDDLGVTGALTLINTLKTHGPSILKKAKQLYGDYKVARTGGAGTTQAIK